MDSRKVSPLNEETNVDASYQLVLRPYQPTDEIDYSSDESSSIHSMPGDEEKKIEHTAVDQTSRKSTKKSSKSSKKKSSKNLFSKQKEEIREKIMKEVMDQILPDLGAYTADGYVPPTRERKLEKYQAMTISFFKFFGCMTLDLHDAVMCGSLSAVKRSVKKILNENDPHPELINQYNQQGVTPLSLAVKINDFEITNHLLDHRALPDYIDESTGRTPIVYSVINGNPKITRLLIHRRANVNTVDFQCLSPLMVAVTKNDLVHCKLLAGARVNVDHQDEHGWTALYHAASHDAVECMAFLLTEGADRRIKDLQKRRPLHIAKFKNHGRCIAILSGKSTIF